MSLRTLIARHLQAAAGSYAPNHFLVTLDAATPFISGPDHNPSENPCVFHIFLHEYWHYLQNVTTVSGFKAFAFTQHLLPPFSKTLLRNADGTSEGNAALTSQECADVRTLLKLHDDLDGQAAPTVALSSDWDVDFQVVGTRQSQATHTYATRIAPSPIVTLDVECTWSDESRAVEQLQLGALAIEESVAFLVEEQARQAIGGAQFEAPPVFPYRVAERTLEHLWGYPPPAFITAALGTLALLTTHPGPGFVQLARAFHAEIEAGADHDSALGTVQQVHQQSVRPIISTILDHDLPGLEQMHQGRGLMQGAVAHVGSTMRRALSRRLREPLFDLRAVFPTASAGSVAVLQRDFPSCDVVQERAPILGVFPRDVIYSLDPADPDALGNEPSSYTRSLQAQQDFVSSHLDRSGSFVPSSQCQSRCPYYDACHLPLRSNCAGVCEQTPWLSNFEPDGSCWYATAVAATLGRVQVRRATASQSPNERVRSRAYQLWDERGRPLGDDWTDWFQAEEEVGRDVGTTRGVPNGVAF